MNWEMDWENIWATIFVLLVITVVILLITLTFHPKEVDYYYLSNQNGQSSTCVFAHWTWHGDERAFCTDDYNRAIDFMAKANAALPARNRR